MKLAYAAVLLAICAVATPALAAPQLKAVLPLVRTTYQTNESIDITVLRSDTQDIPADTLAVTLADDFGWSQVYDFALAAVPAVAASASSAEQLHFNGSLLRPGHYTVDLAVNGADAKTAFDLVSQTRYSSYKLVLWSGVSGKDIATLGADGFGYNLLYGSSGADQQPNLQAGLDYMSCCTMGGGHQMDLRLECDWSDPYVLRGGTRRVEREALMDRTAPNVIGVHFYDEPGLASWYPMPSQNRAYKAAYDGDLLAPEQVDKSNPATTTAWKNYQAWKLGFMDAAWKDANWGVTAVQPDFIGATQSQYGWQAFSDGYYFNVTRSLPVISGHGGYDVFGLLTYNPVWFLDMALARDYDRPEWYMPTFSGGQDGASYKAETYMCFADGTQGNITSPCLPVWDKNCPRDEVAAVRDSNHLMARLGTIFDTMPKSRQSVALLYSITSERQRQVDKDLKYGYETDSMNYGLIDVACKIMQTPPTTIVEEDVLDGTLSRYYKVLLLTRLVALPDSVTRGIEKFIARGGTVLMTSDCTVTIPGAVKVDVDPDSVAAKLAAAKNGKTLATTGDVVDTARLVAKAIAPFLRKAGIAPVFTTDNDEIVGGRQAYGDFEYIFAINATYDRKNGGTKGLYGPGGADLMTGASATISLPDDGRPVYDALASGPVVELKKAAGKLTGRFSFGAGDMRVFARTARPIGSVRVYQPTIQADYTRQNKPPQELDISAALLDTQGVGLFGSAPIKIRVLDPKGTVVYDLYRATDKGLLNLTLPFALNEPTGTYKVVITDLLAGKVGAANFTWRQPADCGAVAGLEHRAIAFGDDRNRIFRFIRTHANVTIVKGTSDYDTVAAARVAETLKPWDVDCKIVDAASVNHSRTLTADEAKTWVGLNFQPAGGIKPGDGNSPADVGYDIHGAVILVGNPEDNPLIAQIRDWRFLPYTPKPGLFPGPGRGMIAWQIGAIGDGQESITLIAHDAAGMSEAVGTMYDAATGMEPLTPWVQPQ